MPLYEYQCEACSRGFELYRKISDTPLEECPTYDRHVQKLASSPTLQFKGSGWYGTDYARKGDTSSSSESKDTKGDSKAETNSDGGTANKADTKSDKSETKS